MGLAVTFAAAEAESLLRTPLVLLLHYLYSRIEFRVEMPTCPAYSLHNLLLHMLCLCPCSRTSTLPWRLARRHTQQSENSMIYMPNIIGFSLANARAGYACAHSFCDAPFTANRRGFVMHGPGSCPSSLQLAPPGLSPPRGELPLTCKPPRAQRAVYMVTNSLVHWLLSVLFGRFVPCCVAVFLAQGQRPLPCDLSVGGLIFRCLIEVP
jgi:hypothetical protein